ncbi:MAG: DNA polymerase III subunit delta [Gammaproteobacteria bacterium]|nr:DNA polymerase III subunit delta [Gammaproteobacteria bacterium]
MIIQYHALEHHLKKNCAAIYILTGTDLYLCQQAVQWIKQAWKRKTEASTEETIRTIQQSSDWAESFQEANTYALFATHCFLDLRYAKKTLDAAGKQQIQTYLETPNPRSLILIQAPSLPAKQVQALASHPQLVHSHILPLTPQAFKKLIIQQLKTSNLQFDIEVPEMIHYYHQSNVMACSQFIEQLALMHDLQQRLTTDILLTYLRDQSEFSIYELGDACLSAKTTHALHIIRQIQHAQGEPTLILWLLSQEIRKLIQLQNLLRSISFQTACQQLKIWSQKTALYQQASQRLSLTQLYTLLQTCQHLDEQIKSNRSGMIWQGLEQLILELAS